MAELSAATLNSTLDSLELNSTLLNVSLLLDSSGNGEAARVSWLFRRSGRYLVHVAMVGSDDVAGCGNIGIPGSGDERTASNGRTTSIAETHGTSDRGGG